MHYAGLPVVQFFEQPGVSATKLPLDERPEGAKLIDLIETEKVVVVISDEQSRLVRGESSAEWPIFYDLCVSHGTLIHTLLDGVTGSDDGSELVATIRAWDARREIRKLRHRSGTGRKMAVEAGKHAGGPRKYGYRYEPYINEKGKLRHTLEIEPEEAEALRLIRDWTVEGRSQTWIARTLNERGFRTAKGAKWSQTRINQMSHNKLYCGFRRSGDRWIKSS